MTCSVNLLLLTISPSNMGGDHGHGKISMPDFQQWKVEGTPLEFTQKRLAARGLKDPWARSVSTPTFTTDIVF